MGKSYAQYCPAATTLDLVGERWTLLIVRELLGGVQRYSDLQRALPGIPPNLLADRLRDLTAHGLVAKRELPPPAARSVFELTADGRALDGVLRELSLWGLRRMQPPDEDRHVGLTMGVRMGLLIHSSVAERPDLVRTWVVQTDEGRQMTLRAAGGHVSAERGVTGDADLVVTIDAAELLRVRMGVAPPGPMPVTFAAGSPSGLQDEFLAVFGLDAAGATP